MTRRDLFKSLIGAALVSRIPVPKFTFNEYPGVLHVWTRPHNPFLVTGQMQWNCFTATGDAFPERMVRMIAALEKPSTH